MQHGVNFVYTVRDDLISAYPESPWSLGQADCDVRGDEFTNTRITHTHTVPPLTHRDKKYGHCIQTIFTVDVCLMPCHQYVDVVVSFVTFIFLAQQQQHQQKSDQKSKVKNDCATGNEFSSVHIQDISICFFVRGRLFLFFSCIHL